MRIGDSSEFGLGFGFGFSIWVGMEFGIQRMHDTMISGGVVVSTAPLISISTTTEYSNPRCRIHGVGTYWHFGVVFGWRL